MDEKVNNVDNSDIELSRSTESMRNVKVSVIIPVYNAEMFLNKCLESVITQSLRDIEVICVDDCSDDASYSIIEDFAARDCRVIPLRNEKNLKAGASRNKGLEASVGEYLFFLDADDYLLPNALNNMYVKARAVDADILRAKAYSFDLSTNERVKNKRYEMSAVPANMMNKVIKFLDDPNIFLNKISVAPWGGIIKKEFVIKNGLCFNDLICVNDRSFFIESVVRAEKIILVNDVVLHHTVNNPDSLISKRAENFSCHMDSYRIIKNQIKSEPIDVQAEIFKSELKDMLVWFEKFRFDYLHELFGNVKGFLKEISGDIELIKSVFAQSTSEHWYKTYSEIIYMTKADYDYKYSKLFYETFDKTKERRDTFECVKIREFINFDEHSDNDIKVSVVVPVYNVSQYLEECLSSIIAQTLKEIEIICVNDGSTDDSLEILKRFAERDKRVKIIDKENAGYGHAMNIGMDMAVGEYTGIVESDDFVLPDMFKDLYEIATKNNVDFVKSDFNRFVYENGVLKTKLFKLSKNPKDYNKIICPFENLNTFKFVKNTWCGIYRTEFLRRCRIRHHESPGASYQDNGFWFKTFSEADSCIFVDKAYYMNRRDNPNSSVYDKRKVFCMVNEFGFIHDYLKKNPLYHEKYIGTFHARKFSAYMFMYDLADNENKLELLKKMQEEYSEALKKDQLDWSQFYIPDIDAVKWIIDDPEDYFSQHNENSIKVSVIIPVYNSDEYLAECLDSVLEQTLSEIEVICIDDGSEDNSLEILREYEMKDPRIKVLVQEHSGGGAARNKGLEIACGEFLSFLDSDDFFDKKMLERIYNKCRSTHSDIGVYKVRTFDNVTKKSSPYANSFVEKNIPQKDFFAPSEMRNNLFSTFQTWAWNKLFRRHFIEAEKIKFQEVMRTNDMFFVNTALMKATRITTLPAELVYYRTNTTQNCQATNSKYPMDFFKALMELKKEVLKCGNADYMIAFENLAVRSCMYNINSLDDPDKFYELYNFFHNTGFKGDNIDLLSIGNHIFNDNRNRYRECLMILNNTFESYMFDKLTYHRKNSENNKLKIKTLEKDLENNKQQIKKLKNDLDNKKAELEKTPYKNISIEFKDKDTLKKSNDKVVSEVQSCKNEIVRLKNDFRSVIDTNSFYSSELINIKASLSYKIGRFITWFPRKIRDLFKKS